MPKPGTRSWPVSQDGSSRVRRSTAVLTTTTSGSGRRSSLVRPSAEDAVVAVRREVGHRGDAADRFPTGYADDACDSRSIGSGLHARGTVGAHEGWMVTYDADTFLQFLTAERRLSPNTLAAYRNDLRQFEDYLAARQNDPLGMGGSNGTGGTSSAVMAPADPTTATREQVAGFFLSLRE